MKTIKIKFVDFWEGFQPLESIFYKVLVNKYNLVLSDEPDYIFYSVFGFEHFKYDCIRIFYTGEQVSPDFDMSDYAIGFDYLDFGDRYIRYPLYLLSFSKDELMDSLKVDSSVDMKDRQFCSFVYSNEYALTNRDDFFLMLSEYKKVNSGGRHLNNIGTRVLDKIEYLSRHKFTIAFENSTYPGYTTEKILDGFLSNSVPIYFGNPLIGHEFSDKSFINLHNFDSFESAINRIIEIDNDEDQYLRILNSARIHDESSMPTIVDLENFLYKIFDQEQSLAKRRPHSIRSLKKIRVLKLFAFLNRIYYLLPKVVRKNIQNKTYKL